MDRALDDEPVVTASREVLFSTPHGSHLYGLATPTSDNDTYTVVTRLPHVAHNGTRARYARQTIRGDEDAVVIDLSTFMLLCDKGVPQALEAMFSPVATVDRIPELRAGYRAGNPAPLTYRRTIANFLQAEGFKRRRHAFRLALNCATMERYGRFCPVLSADQAEEITTLAGDPDADPFHYLT